MVDGGTSRAGGSAPGPLSEFSAADYLRHWRTQAIDQCPSRGTVLAQCNESGTFQLYELTVQTGQRRQLTFGSTAATGRYGLNGDVIVGMDNHGDQKFTLWRLLPGGELERHQ